MAARRKTKPARRKASESGEAAALAAHSPRVRLKARTSVGLKIILTTSSVVALSMVVFSIFLYQKFAAALSEEVDQAGVLAVNVMASVDDDAWRSADGTSLEWRRGMATIVPVEGDIKFANDKEKKAYEHRRDFNRGRLERLVESKGVRILDAVVIDNGKPKPSVINGQPIAIPSAEDRETPSGVLIREAPYQQKGAVASHRARIYQKKLRDENGEVTGTAILALSLASIDERLAAIRNGGIFLTVIFIGLGLLASWFVSQRIVRPIAVLAEDIEIVSRGDLGHRTVAQTDDEIGVLARAFDDMTANLFEAQEMQARQAKHEHQLEIAQQVQAALFPAELPRMPGYDTGAEARAADEVGGTWYDLIPRPDGSQVAVVASASSGGIPGAMIAAMARSLIKGCAESGDSPADVLRTVNRLLAADLRRGMYVTVLMVQVDPEQHRAVVANAGHYPLLICRAGTQEAEPFHTDGIALGFDKGPVFDRTLKNAEVELDADSRLVLCTRSLFKVASPEGREIGEPAVHRALAAHTAKNSAAFVAMVMNGLQRHAQSTEPTEDLALLTLKRTRSA